MDADRLADKYAAAKKSSPNEDDDDLEDGEFAKKLRTWAKEKIGANEKWGMEFEAKQARGRAKAKAALTDHDRARPKHWLEN